MIYLHEESLLSLRVEFLLILTVLIVFLLNSSVSQWDAATPVQNKTNMS